MDAVPHKICSVFNSGSLLKLCPWLVVVLAQEKCICDSEMTDIFAVSDACNSEFMTFACERKLFQEIKFQRFSLTHFFIQSSTE